MNGNWQIVLTMVCLAGAAVVLVRRLYRFFSAKSGKGGCGTGGCGSCRAVPVSIEREPTGVLVELDAAVHAPDP